MDTDNLRNEVLSCGRRARAAARSLSRTNTERKDSALLAMADQLCASAGTILQANGKDVERATADQLSLAMIDRLKLDEKRIQAMANGIRQVAALDDPVGKNIAEWTRPNGLLIPKTGRDAVRHMAEMDQYIDLIVPRGGRPLIETVVTYARMPVIKHYLGVCIAYVDREADLDMAVQIVVNAKTQRPGVCNAIETVLVHREIAAPFFKKIAPELAGKKVEIRADPDSFHQLSAIGYQPLHSARDEDWTTEYLDLILAARTVDNIEDAIAHVEKYGSHHSDVIITRDAARAEKFLNEVDSATVYWNASTRFTDGGEFGFGAEIGISTDKLHARGPMALEELTSYKYVIRGEGQIRE